MRVINKNQKQNKVIMRTKQLFKIRLLSLVALCCMALTVASCANEDIVQNGKDPDNDKNYTEFVGGRPETRTTMDYNGGAFYWEAGDKIYVQDDNGDWQVSNNAPTGKVASFKFKVPGKFTDKASYKVYYPGKNGTDNNVTISATQNQTEPNSTAHFGVSGDCGTADAARANGFHFLLDHQAAILVFQPYNANSELDDCYLTKIEVTSDNNIAGAYTLDPTTGKLTGTGAGKEISIETTGSGAYTKGFPLTNNASNLATTGTYMLIQPGEHKLKVRYYIKDYSTNVEGSIMKELSNFDYKKNNYYDMNANLDMKDYDGNNYYMWDAQQQYWYGYEWTRHLSGNAGQPTLNNNSSPNYPQSNSDVSRWYHEGGGSGRYDATRSSCKDLPNVNEMSWYCMYGDPRWDGDELWTTMGHLYKGGMWFKKKSVLLAEGNYNTEKSADGTTDLRTTYKNYNNTNSSINSGVPSAADANKYFYLPALGYNDSGQLNGVGNVGGYWSSSARPWVSNEAYSLTFYSGFVGAGNSNRYVGFRAEAFQ